MGGFTSLLKRDLLLAWREGGTLGMALGFYLAIIAIVPLGVGPDLKLLSRLAPGLLWIALSLCILLSIDRIFLNDHEEGALELFMLSEMPVPLIAVAKALAHWLTTGVPLALSAPLLGLMLNLEPQAFVPLVLSCLIGSLAMSFLAMLGAALTLGLKRGGLLLPFLILPFFTPLLVFGVGATTSYIAGQSFLPQLAILSGIVLFILVIAPLAAGPALKIHMR